MIVVGHDDRKKAFRVAYNFLEQHLDAVEKKEEYLELAEDLATAFSENKDNPLACRLISGVWDFLCAESKRMIG